MIENVKYGTAVKILARKYSTDVSETDLFQMSTIISLLFAVEKEAALEDLMKERKA